MSVANNPGSEPPEQHTENVLHLKDVDYDLSVIHVIYGIGFGFGFQELAIFIHTYFTTKTVSFLSVDGASLATLFGAILMLGLRLFWAIGNIRRYIARGKAALTETTSRMIVLVHFPTTVLQAFTFFILCRLLNDVWTVTEFSAVFLGNMVAFMLATNASWLVLLNAPPELKNPERTWAVNNLAFAALIPFILVIASGASSAAQLLIIGVSVVFNSFIDVYLTSKWYIASASR